MPNRQEVYRWTHLLAADVFLILMGIDRPETNHLIFPKFCFVFSISIIVFPPNDWHTVITFFNLPLLPLIFIVIQICLSYISLYLSLGPLDKVCKKYSGLNWKQNCMPKGIKGQLSSNWTKFGQFLDNTWTIFGWYLDNIVTRQSLSYDFFPFAFYEMFEIIIFNHNNVNSNAL